MATNKIINNAVIISFVFVLINLGILGYMREIANLFFIETFIIPLCLITIVVVGFYYVWIIYYIDSNAQNTISPSCEAFLAVPSLFILLVFCAFFTPTSKIDTTLKSEILASMDKTEQKIFEKRCNLDGFGFHICNRDDYSSQRCVDYLNNIIDDTKKKAQKLKNEEEPEHKMRALIEKLDI